MSELYFDMKPEVRKQLCECLESFGFKEFNLLVWNKDGFSHVTTNLDLDSAEDFISLFELEVSLTQLALRLNAMFEMVTKKAGAVHQKLSATK